MTEETAEQRPKQKCVDEAALNEEASRGLEANWSAALKRAAAEPEDKRG